MTPIQRTILWVIIIFGGYLAMAFGINYYITHDVIWSGVVTVFIAGLGVISAYTSRYLQGGTSCRQQNK
jgi:hypothetical protein